MNEPIDGAAFVCFNVGKGYGGHYLSLAETALSGIFSRPVIVDMGFAPVPLLDSVRTEHIPYTWFGNARARRALCNLIEKNEVEMVLCYDIPSFIVVQYAMAGTGLKIVYVKCGGPLLTLYYPRPQNLIVYSMEDEAFFSERVPGAKMARIPNRVREHVIKAKQEPLYDDRLEALIEDAGERVVCVARISHAYERKIRRAFDYCNARRTKGANVSLTIIGSIQHREVADSLFNDAPCGTVFLTDSKHTRDVARFLGNFDSAITTGRGTVEAVFCGLNVFVPFDSSERLAALSPANYQGLARTNFSGRAQPEEVLDQRLEALSEQEKGELLDLVRGDYALEHAGKTFRAFLDRLHPSPLQSLRDVILGWLYLRHDALRERSQFARGLTRRLRISLAVTRKWKW